MRKNGFTLTELMAVVIILGLLVGIASFGVVNTVNRSKIKSAEKMRDDLLDSAVAYGLENIFLTKCSTGFDPKNPTSRDVKCYQEILASKIIEEEAIYRDDAKHCDRSGKIIIYNDNGEYKASAEENICSN